MDFRIVEEKKEENKKKSNFPIVIIVVAAIVVGLLVFFVSNALFGEKKPETKNPTPQQLTLTDENVKILYSYVTYGSNGKRGEKFLKEKNVTVASFTDEEKFEYALQFVQAEDFIATGKTNDKKQKLYLIDNGTIKKYMQRYFGPTVTYNPVETIKYAFDFSVNDQNVGNMTYQEADDGYITVFDGKETKDEPTETALVDPYYTKLVSATKELDGSYTLVEKIIYTKLEKQDDKYNISIFKDYDCTALLEKTTDQTEETIKTNPITIDKYLNNAATITYTFKVSGGTLYFYSSSITNS